MLRDIDLGGRRQSGHAAAHIHGAGGQVVWLIRCAGYDGEVAVFIFLAQAAHRKKDITEVVPAGGLGQPSIHGGAPQLRVQGVRDNAVDDVRHQLRQGFAGINASVVVRAQQQANPGDAAKFPLLPARAGDGLHVLFGDEVVVMVIPHNVAVVVAVEPVPVTLGSQKRPSNANDSNSAKALGHHKPPIRRQKPGLEPRIPHHRRQRVGGEGFHGEGGFYFRRCIYEVNPRVGLITVLQFVPHRFFSCLLLLD